MLLNKKEVDLIERLKLYQEELFNKEYFSLERFVDDQKVLDELFKDSMDLKTQINIFLKNICNSNYSYSNEVRVKSDIVMLTTLFMAYKSEAECKIAYLFLRKFNGTAEKVQENFDNDCKTFSEIREKMKTINF